MLNLRLVSEITTIFQCHRDEGKGRNRRVLIISHVKSWVGVQKGFGLSSLLYFKATEMKKLRERGS